MFGKKTAITALLIVIAVLSGCFSTWEPDEAVVTINLGGSGSRAAEDDGEVTPEDLIKLLHHKITLSGPSGVLTREFEKGAVSAQFTVVAGLYNITVEALIDPADLEELIDSVEAGSSEQDAPNDGKSDGNSGSGDSGNTITADGGGDRIISGRGLSAYISDRAIGSDADDDKINFEDYFEIVDGKFLIARGSAVNVNVVANKNNPVLIKMEWHMPDDTDDSGNSGDPDEGNNGSTTYTITFNFNGGWVTSEAIISAEAPANATITLPGGNGLAKTGYIFGGWNTMADGTGTNYAAGSAYKVTGNVTLYAKWDDDPTVGITLTFAPPTLNIAAGGTGNLILYIDSDIAATVELRSDNPGVAAIEPISDITVASGTTTSPVTITVNGVAAGETFITATAKVGSDTIKIATCEVTVTGTGSSGWRGVYVSGIFDSVTAIAYGDGTFVVGGTADSGTTGILAYSDDNMATWNTPSYSSFIISAIAYGNGTFVAVGNNGNIAYSTDNGVTWNPVTSPPFGSVSINDIAFGDGMFIIVSNDGQIAYSTNGTSWSMAVNPLGSFPIFTVAYCNNMFAAGSASGNMVYSNDEGFTWFPATLDTNNYSINAIAYGNGMFVAGGEGYIAYSSSITGSWIVPNPNPFEDLSISDIIYDNGKFVAVCNLGKIALSTDGTIWEIVDLTGIFSNGIILAVTYGNGRYVIGGQGGQMAYLVE